MKKIYKIYTTNDIILYGECEEAMLLDNVLYFGETLINIDSFRYAVVVEHLSLSCGADELANKIVIKEESLNYFKINDKIKIDKDGNSTIYPNIIKGCTCK